MNRNRLINAAKDCVAQFRVTGFPLKNVARDIIQTRKLNSSERKLLLDLVFTFAREVNLVDSFIEQTYPFANAMTKQQRENYAIDLLAAKEAILDHQNNNVSTDEYQAWLKDLGEKRYFLSLGPLIGNILHADYPREAYVIAEGLYQRAIKYLAIDQKKISIERVKEAVVQQKIPYFEHHILPTALGVFEINISSLPDEIRRHIWLMDAGSQIIAELIKPKPEDKVLDMCAGEGIKARYIAQNACHYTAVDVDGGRLLRAQKNIKNAKFICDDAVTVQLPSDHFDWILLDAPCSGIGVLRRHYDLVHRFTHDNLKKYTELQWQLLMRAVYLLKPGGKIIYATCSLFKAENEQQIHRLLQQNSQVKSLKLADLVGENLRINAQLLDKNCLTFFPHIDNCDGFFCAALSKH
jgi:16S rRNA C967 or C1407 C5-methylase (RsmB/RsmF family)